MKKVLGFLQLEGLLKSLKTHLNSGGLRFFLKNFYSFYFIFVSVPA